MVPYSTVQAIKTTCSKRQIVDNKVRHWLPVRIWYIQGTVIRHDYTQNPRHRTVDQAISLISSLFSSLSTFSLRQPHSSDAYRTARQIRTRKADDAGPGWSHKDRKLRRPIRADTLTGLLVCFTCYLSSPSSKQRSRGTSLLHYDPISRRPLEANPCMQDCQSLK